MIDGPGGRKSMIDTLGGHESVIDGRANASP
jgi:hypothetical protein